MFSFAFAEFLFVFCCGCKHWVTSPQNFKKKICVCKQSPDNPHGEIAFVCWYKLSSKNTGQSSTRLFFANFQKRTHKSKVLSFVLYTFNWDPPTRKWFSCLLATFRCMRTSAECRLSRFPSGKLKSRQTKCTILLSGCEYIFAFHWTCGRNAWGKCAVVC